MTSIALAWDSSPSNSRPRNSEKKKKLLGAPASPTRLPTTTNTNYSLPTASRRGRNSAAAANPVLRAPTMGCRMDSALRDARADWAPLFELHRPLRPRTQVLLPVLDDVGEALA